MNTSNNQRRGRFKIAGFLLNDWERLLPMMSNFVVVRCEFMYGENVAEYTAYSPLFDEVPEGEPAPEYNVICEKVAFRCERIGPTK